MLNNIVLIIAIVTADDVLIDHEFYDSKLSCEAVSRFINEYPSNKSMIPRVSSICVNIDPESENIENKDV